MELKSIDVLFSALDEETRNTIKGLFLAYGSDSAFVKPVNGEWDKTTQAFIEAVQSFAKAVQG